MSVCGAAARVCRKGRKKERITSDGLPRGLFCRPRAYKTCRRFILVSATSRQLREMADVSIVEETIKRISSHKGIVGVLIVNGDGIPIRSTLENSLSVQYAGLVNAHKGVAK